MAITRPQMDKKLTTISGMNIYISDFIHRNVKKCAKLISDDLKKLNLENDEGVIVFTNKLQLAINSPSKITESLTILGDIKKTIETNFLGEDAQGIDISHIPDNLKSLIPFLEEWTISDYENRQIKIESSSQSELEHLIAEITPKINQINDYLDSFGDTPLTNEAILIGNLAELVDEISSNQQ